MRSIFIASVLSLLAATTAYAQTDAALTAASKEQGAQVTKSGLVYRSLKDGTGNSPAATDKVKVHDR